MAGPPVPAPTPLVHRALVYGHEDEFVQGVAAFARDGVAAGEATMVLAAPDRLRALRRELGAGAPVDWLPNPLSALRVGIAFDDVRRHLAGRAAPAGAGCASRRTGT